MKSAMKIEHIKIDQIKLNPKNPRQITEQQLEKLKNSIKDFPEMLELRPLIIDKRFVVIGGNMRFQAAKKLGLKIVPVIKAENLSAAQIKEFIIKDNIGFGLWDWEVLQNWDESKLQEWGLPAPYTGHEVNGMTDEGLSVDETFDPIGASKGLQRVVFIFDNASQAEAYLLNLGNLEVKKFNNAWHINLSSQSI